MDFESVFCLLCYKPENSVNAVSCDEEPKVVTILCRQFWFAPEEIQRKYVCGICWTYVDDFNNFYEQIKMIHDAEQQEEIVLEDDPIHYQDSDLNETEILLEGESPMLEDEIGFDESHESDPLLNHQTKVKTIVIESIDIEETFNETPTKTIDEFTEEIEEGSCKQQEARTMQNFKNIISSESHSIENETKQQTERYACDECHLVLPTEALMDEHRKQHPTYSLQHTCEECGKSYSTERRLQQHHKRDHGPGLMCDICSKWFKTGDGLRNHQKNCHYPQPTERVECSICKRWLKNIGSLNKHMVRHKTSGKPNICEICGKVAPTYTALKSHKLFVHEMQRTFRCLVCKKAFKRAFTLKEHMSTHTGSSLYNCPHCTRTFNSSANLHAHKKKKHPKEWEKSRNEYEKRFTGKH
ncbi:transcription factor grauzone-like [Anopheles funestus]|uniref:C2H2-type domain-containing protein n=1 Tax=Anopheles funestus TaxID=62324 RepID=A0A182R2L0_ANOFN|nr:transcription factor grauzone-like [Anopheles funestus]